MDYFAGPPSRSVRAGEFAATLDGGDLRWVSVGETEIVHAIRVSVRDAEWGTVPGVLSDIRTAIDSDRFLVTFSSHHSDPDVDFLWHGEIQGRPDGSITYAMRGSAERGFEYGRIGIDVLHPLASSGRRYRAVTEAGEVEGELPTAIGPQEFVDGGYVGLFDPFTELELEIHDGLSVHFALEGQLFEMEDQRNWTDASFKSYSTPLADGLLHETYAGQEFAQRVTVTPLQAAGRRAVPASPRDGSVRVELLSSSGRHLPAIGVQLADGPLSRQEVELLRALRLDHLRVDVRLGEAGWEESVRRASADSAALGAPLELALHVSPDGVPDLRGLAGEELARVLVFLPDPLDPPGPLVAEVRERLRSLANHCPVGGGSDGAFVDLNAARPGAEDVDVVAYPVSPQAHAFDERSLVETLPIQGVTVENARSFCPGRPIAITPVTLLPRSGGAAISSVGGLAPDVDVRQASLFGAAWTLGSVAHLSAAGADSVTYYETAGPRGLLMPEAAPAPDRSFPARPGDVFPAYHVFAELVQMRNDQLLESTVDATTVAAVATRAGAATHTAVANLSAAPQRVNVGPFASAGATVRMLDAATDTASRSGTSRISERAIDVVAGRVTLTMPPYASAWIAGNRD
jgi:hypothetical protein